jgi:zinc protease
MSHSADLLVGPRSTSFASQIQRVRTESGVEAWLIEDHSMPLLSMSFAFKGGATQDPAGKPGVSAMLAGLLDKGAGTRDGAAFQQALDDDAIELCFGIDCESLPGQMRTLSSARSQAFDLLSAALCVPRFDPDALQRQRDQAAAGLQRALHDPAEVAARAFRNSCYGDHPYGRSVTGDLESLSTITHDDIIAIRSRTMARDNLKIACVGAIDAVELREQLDRSFGGLPPAAQLACVPLAATGGVGTRQVIPLDVPQSMIRFGRQGIKRDDTDYDAATVVNHCLGAGSFTSRLFREVREKRGLCYSIQSQNLDLDQAALFGGVTATSNERAAEALDVIDEQLRLMAEQGIGAGELAKAKQYLVGSYALRFDTSRKIAGLLCKLQLNGTDAGRLDTRNASIAAVSVEDAARTASRLIGNGDMLVVIAGKPAGL